MLFNIDSMYFKLCRGLYTPLCFLRVSYIPCNTIYTPANNPCSLLRKPRSPLHNAWAGHSVSYTQLQVLCRSHNDLNSPARVMLRPLRVPYRECNNPNSMPFGTLPDPNTRVYSLSEAPYVHNVSRRTNA